MKSQINYFITISKLWCFFFNLTKQLYITLYVCTCLFLEYLQLPLVAFQSSSRQTLHRAAILLCCNQLWTGTDIYFQSCISILIAHCKLDRKQYIFLFLPHRALYHLAFLVLTKSFYHLKRGIFTFRQMRFSLKVHLMVCVACGDLFLMCLWI